MDENKIEETRQTENYTRKITAIDFYTIAFTSLQLYLLRLSLDSFTGYLGSYLSGKFFISHIIAFLNGLVLFLILINLVGVGRTIKSDNYTEKKDIVVGIFNTSVFIILLYAVIQISSARMPY